MKWKDLKRVQIVSLKTPFGNPSDSFIVGQSRRSKVVFLPRHGKGHRIAPSFLNYRANIYGFKKLGVEWIIGVSAVGSMKESIHPGDMVIPDQLIDRTVPGPAPFSAKGLSAMSVLRTPSVLFSVRSFMRQEKRPEQPSRRMERTSAWKGLSFRPAPNQSFTGPGGWISLE